MFCNKCGKELPDGTKFCSGCGSQLADGASDASSSSTAKPVEVSAAGGDSLSSSPANDTRRLFAIAAAITLTIAIIAMFLPWAQFNFSEYGLPGNTASATVFEIAEGLNNADAISADAKQNANLEAMVIHSSYADAKDTIWFGIVIWGLGIAAGIGGIITVLFAKPLPLPPLLLGPAVSAAVWCFSILNGIDSKLQDAIKNVNDLANRGSDLFGTPVADLSAFVKAYDFSASIVGSSALFICLIFSIAAFLLYMKSDRAPLIKA